MHEPFVSLAKVVAYTMWALVILLTLSAWLVWAMNPDGPWVLLATTACASSAIAATAQMRLYCSRVCRLLRQGFDMDAEHGVRSLR